MFYVSCCFILSNSFWAIASTEALESTRAYIVRVFSKSRGTFSDSLRFKTTVEVSSRYNSLVCSSLTNLFSMCGVVPVNGGMLLYPLGVVIMCLSYSLMSVGQLLELLRNGTSLFPVWIFRTCPVAVTDFCGWIPFGGNVWLGASVGYLFSSSSVVWFILIAESL